MPTTVVLADDHQIIREGLRSLIDDERDMTVVGEAQNGAEAASVVEECRPDVVVLDIGMPGLNGIDAARRIVKASPETKVVALSMFSERTRVDAMLRAGASAYVLKDAAFRELLQAIRAVTRGQGYLSPAIAGQVVMEYRQHMPRGDATADDLLTNREREVLQRLAEGERRREIAERLSVSIKTVEAHCRSIMKKLELHSIAELTKYAVRTGLTEL